MGTLPDVQKDVGHADAQGDSGALTAITTILDKTPPFLVAIMAGIPRRGGLTHQALAKKSGLSLRMVERLAAKTSWVGVPVDVASCFMVACGVDFMQPSKALRYLAQTIEAQKPLKHLSTIQRRAFNRRMLAFLEKARPKNF